MECVRPRTGFDGGKRRGVRIVTGRTVGFRARTAAEIPEALHPPMDAPFPIPIGWAVAASTQPISFGELERLSLVHPKLFEVFGVVAVEAVIVAILPPVPHDEILVRFG